MFDSIYCTTFNVLIKIMKAYRASDSITWGPREGSLATIGVVAIGLVTLVVIVVVALGANNFTDKMAALLVAGVVALLVGHAGDPPRREGWHIEDNTMVVYL